MNNKERYINDKYVKLEDLRSEVTTNYAGDLFYELLDRALENGYEYGRFHNEELYLYSKKYLNERPLGTIMEDWIRRIIVDDPDVKFNSPEFIEKNFYKTEDLISGKVVVNIPQAQRDNLETYLNNGFIYARVGRDGNLRVSEEGVINRTPYEDMVKYGIALPDMISSDELLSKEAISIKDTPKRVSVFRKLLTILIGGNVK
ncbi:hypothetical protein [Priestia megaterium]|uniref:hypothetical protein n=1 Tax=Priestia megaterium TaxID=1404 RepID=UPI003CC58B4C